MDDFSSGIIGLIIFLAVVGIIIAVIIYLATILLAIVATIGSVIGIAISIKNYALAIQQVISERRSIGGFVSENEKQALGSMPYTGAVYEQSAGKSYVLGPAFIDLFNAIKLAIMSNYQYRPDFSGTEKDNAILTIMAKVIVICKAISVYVFGTLFTIVFSFVLAAIAGVCAAVIFPAAGIILLIDKIYFSIKKISFRCPSCKREYQIPKYVCPVCNITHTRLKPGRYGVIRRRCLCGTILPLTAKGKGIIFEHDPSTGEIIKKPLMLTDLDSFCPHCDSSNNAGLSHPISIALIGGASAGKTTFKVAFQHEFLTEETAKYGIDIDFSNDTSRNEYQNAEFYFSGKKLIPSTKGDLTYDISTFSFSLKNKSFEVDRMVQLYDLPGERFINGDAKDGWEHYSFAEGAVFIIDPFSIAKVKIQNDDEIKGASMGICTTDINLLVESLINTLSNVRAKRAKSGKFAIPIALAINKVDTPLLSRQCGEEAVEQLMANAPEAFPDQFLAMDYACRCFLSANGGDNFIANLDNNFEYVHFFYCSSIGYIPKASLTTFEPKNVLEIMQWMMLRADKKQLGSVWKPANAVEDLTDEQKSLYLTKRFYYENYVEANAEIFV